MPTFGRESRDNLATCDERLQRLAWAAIENGPDFSVTEGHRPEHVQNEKYANGLSRLRWPDSKHNAQPSKAVHFVPYPIVWPQKDDPEYAKQVGRFYYLAGYVMRTAEQLGISVRWGGDWSQDHDIMDQDFDDLAHLELVD